MGNTKSLKMKKKQISIPVYTDEESKKTIEDGAKAVSLNVSAFCRTAAYREAIKVLKEKGGNS